MPRALRQSSVTSPNPSGRSIALELLRTGGVLRRRCKPRISEKTLVLEGAGREVRMSCGMFAIGYSAGFTLAMGAHATPISLVAGSRARQSGFGCDDASDACEQGSYGERTIQGITVTPCDGLLAAGRAAPQDTPFVLARAMPRCAWAASIG